MEHNWVYKFQRHRMHQDFGENLFKTYHNNPVRLALTRFLFHPYMEIVSFSLIVISIAALVWEITYTDSASVSWMSQHKAEISFLNLLDFAITVLFTVEYCLKFLVAPQKTHFFKRSLIDAVAILPIFRVFRLFRTLKLLKTVRIIRALKATQIFRSEIVKEKSAVFFQSETTSMLSYLVLSIAFGTIGILITERGINENFKTLEDGLWWCIVTITTVGYGDMFPITLPGKLVAIGIMFVGLSFYALLTGTISTILIEKAQNYGDKSMNLNLLEDHIVVCGWNDQLVNLIDNLLCTTTRQILVIAENFEHSLSHNRIEILRACPSKKEVLLKANIQEAFSAIILADTQENAQSSDAKGILIALAIQICNPKVHITLQLQDPDNVEHAQNAGVEDFIIPTSFQGSLLAQSASSPGVSKIFSKIFNDPNIFVTKESIPSTLKHPTYLQVIQYYAENQLGSILGLMKENEIFLTPNPIDLIESDTLLLVLKTPKT